MSLAFQEMQDMTVLMVYHFNAMRLPAISYLLTYSPSSERNEFDVSACEEIIQEKFPEVKIALPKTAADQLHMEARIFQEEKHFIKNKFNILEPLDGKFLDSKLIDLLFVPLLAFNLQGYRVGYGKGYYDLYLAGCRSDAIKIGFSFFDPLESIGDINQFDVPLNFCITPTRIYEF